MSLPVNKRTVGITFYGGSRACVWAPDAKCAEIDVGGKRTAMDKDEKGYWEATGCINAGDRYRFVVDEKELPDPASLAQPEGVHGPSMAIDTQAFEWTDHAWKNLPLKEYIFYELHTGTFTEEGHFESIIPKLDYLRELGVTAIELMPVAQFPGERNWGYDGVFPFAVQQSYGGAAGLQKLVNACHESGLAVVLDVVYNHLGPEGNYLPMFGPYFTDKYKTPWGMAVNYDDAGCDEVRRYFVENALMWLRDFHIDALRLDAVHAIRDFSPVHILSDITHAVSELEKVTGQRHYIIAECDLNDRRFIDKADKGGYGAHAQWNDEFHHALRVASGNARNGYFSDFNGVAHLAKAYRDAYVFDGKYSQSRKKTFGTRTDNPGEQFVVFSQNHDQVGNRMLGERTSMLVSLEMQKLMAAAVMVSPYLPLLFMGEEWSAPTPFLYFVDHGDKDLQEAVRKGRQEEFKAFHAEGKAPDPTSPETFEQSKLPWHLLVDPLHQEMLEYYKQLIRLRKSIPALFELSRSNLIVDHDADKQLITLHRWHEESRVQCFLNFSQQPVSFTVSGETSWHVIWDSSCRDAELNWRPTGVQVQAAGKIVVQPESVIILSDTYV